MISEPRSAIGTPGAIARLVRAKAWLFDMDGVMYRGNEPLPGVQALLDRLDERKVPFMLATNNSMATPQQYVDRLAGMNIRVKPHEILTSAIATRVYLEHSLPAGSGVFVVGMPALSDQLFDDMPFHAVSGPEEQPAAVVVGLDTNFTYEKLKLATIAIRAGARFIATNTDATLPTESGLMPGCGSLIAAVETATSVAPEVIGKPEPRMLEMAASELGIAPADTVMVGDRLDTDIVAGQRAGMLTVMVLTGISRRDEIATATAAPDLVLDDLPALLRLLDEQTEREP